MQVMCEHRLVSANTRSDYGMWTQGRLRCDLCNAIFFMVASEESRSLMQRMGENEWFNSRLSAANEAHDAA